jgi:CheY-like chemotaxis protein
MRHRRPTPTSSIRCVADWFGLPRVAQGLPVSLIVKSVSRSVLVVDDDGDWRGLVADILAEEGFVVATASDGRAACDCLSRVRPAVVITDVDMPFMDGCALLAKLHRRDRGLPVIVMTADAEADAASFAQAFCLIRKPATTDDVVTAVRGALLHHHRQTRAGELWSAARAAMDVARERSYATIVRTVNRCRRPTKANAATARPAITPQKRRRGRLAVMAGLGVAAAFLIAALRGTTA